MDSAGLREHGQKRPSADDVYKALMEASTDLMVLLHPDGRVACVNPAARTTLGYRSDELVDHHFSEFIDEDERPRAASLFNAATRGRPHVREGVRVRHRDGRPVDFG